MYKPILSLLELQDYLSGTAIVAFDFETAPDEKYRNEEKSALDAHKSHIVGISFSVVENNAVYLPLTHKVGENAENQEEIWLWLADFFMNSNITKIAHNLAFESQFLYAHGIIVQEPCYDTIATAQLIYKNEKEFRTLSDCGLKTLVKELFNEHLPSYEDTVGNKHFDELDVQDEKTIRIATGRIHPDLLPLATETGRFASRSPNCQNMPRAGADDVGVRNFMVAPEGKLLLSLDFSQIELRVGAFYCKDERMLETYQNSGDIHALTTAVIYRIPIEEASDKNHPQYKGRRTIAKNCNFGTFFGLFPKGLQKTLKFKAGLTVSLEECETIIRNLKIGYPRLQRWQEEVKKRASFRRYTETWLGRRRNIPDIISSNWSKKSFAERVAMNTPIQGAAADILKLSMARILKGLPDRPWLMPILQIHDELVFEIPEKQLKNAVIFIKNCMETQPFEAFSVPIIAEAAAGRRFDELHEWEV